MQEQQEIIEDLKKENKTQNKNYEKLLSRVKQIEVINKTITMKIYKHITAVLILLITLNISAQQGINYKALVKDGSGNVVASQSITVQFKILQGGGLTNVYQETHTPTTDANGIIIINIGEGTVDSGVFANIDWGSDNHFLNVQINTGGGLTDMGTTQFMAVPYALSAANAATSINELSDGKSDADGSSLFLGKDAGLNDDGTDNKNTGVGFNTLYYNTSGALNTANGYQALYKNITGNNNTANGYTALIYNIEGNDNTANGSKALLFNIEGNGNTAIGSRALENNISGTGNTANGSSSLRENTTGIFNVAMGREAGLNSLGDSNIFIGYKSGFNETGSNKLYIHNRQGDANNALIYGEFDTNILRTNSEFQIGNPTVTGYAFPTVDGAINQVLQTDGSGSLSWNASVQSINDLVDGKSDADGSSVFIGVDAGLNDDGTGNQNTGVGFNTLFNNINGYRNSANGYQALYNNTSGAVNTANGFFALYKNTTGSGNTANGGYTLYNNTTGSGNTANGNQALFSNTIGLNNTANGSNALYWNTTGSENTASGSQALFNNTIGFQNTASGYQSLNTNTLGFNNTANGYQALYSNTTGSTNTANGAWSLNRNSTGSFNTANGSNALYWNTTGIQNTANGYQALVSNKTGNENTAHGYRALGFNLTGIRNTANGSQALYKNSSGHYNTANGYKALYNSTGNNNTAMGRQALFDLIAGSNNIGIGYNAQPSSTTVSNEVTIGNSANNAYRIFAAGWSNASDRKLKHAIKNIPVGLDFVLKLRPVQFVYNNANNEQKTFGFIAQEVKQVVKHSNLEDTILVSPLNKEYLGLRTTELISVLTKAIQEQQEIIEGQNNKINTLTTELSALKSLDSRVKQLEALLNTNQQ